MEGLLQGLKPEAKVTFSEEVKVISKVKTKSYPRDLKEVRRMVQEHRYQDIVSGKYFNVLGLRQSKI